MKKKIELNKKTIKRLKLKLEPQNDRKVAPVVLDAIDIIATPTGGKGCQTSHPVTSCF